MRAAPPYHVVGSNPGGGGHPASYQAGTTTYRKLHTSRDGSVSTTWRDEMGREEGDEAIQLTASLQGAKRRYYIFVLADLYFFVAALFGVIHAEPEEGITEEHFLCAVLLIDVVCAMSMACMVSTTLEEAAVEDGWEGIYTDHLGQPVKCNGLSMMGAINVVVNAITTIIWFYCRFGTVHHAVLLALLGLRCVKFYPMWTFYLALLTAANSDNPSNTERFKGIREWGGESWLDRALEGTFGIVSCIIVIIFLLCGVGIVILFISPPGGGTQQPEGAVIEVGATTRLFASSASVLLANASESAEARFLDDNPCAGLGSMPSVSCHIKGEPSCLYMKVELDYDRTFQDGICNGDESKFCYRHLSVLHIPHVKKGSEHLMEIAQNGAMTAASGAGTGAMVGDIGGPFGAALGGALGTAWGVYNAFTSTTPEAKPRCYTEIDYLKGKEEYFNIAATCAMHFCKQAQELQARQEELAEAQDRLEEHMQVEQPE